MMKTLVALVVAVVLSLSAPVAYAKEKKPYNPGSFFTSGGEIFGSVLNAKFYGFDVLPDSTLYTKVKKCDGKFARFKVTGKKGDFELTRKYNLKLFPKKMVVTTTVKTPGYKKKTGSTTLDIKQYAGC